MPVTNISPEVDRLAARLSEAQPRIAARERRYSGIAPLRYTADEVTGELARFNVNLCRLAVDAVAERMRVKRIHAWVGDTDVSNVALRIWQRNDFGQILQPLLVDALALGAAYIIVWAHPETGEVTITPEPATAVAVERHPITGEVISAIKRWTSTGPGGVTESEHVVMYERDRVRMWSRLGAGPWSELPEVHNPLGAVPVVPLVNSRRLGDLNGSSVIDDMAHLVDALSKILADVLVASEDVARPRRWATGVSLEEEDDDDGFSADAAEAEDAGPREVVSPFESGSRMFTVESPDAKFGQLDGANLAGYRTAVDLILQQIMAISALPAHMVGVTTANPSSADAIRAAEASLTARAESRIKVLGIALERALALAVSIATGSAPEDVRVQLDWASAATRSTAQEADAAVKLATADILTREEARDALGVDAL